MEHTLVLSALIIGVIGWAILFLLVFSRRPARFPAHPTPGHEPNALPNLAASISRSFVALAFLLPIGIWVATWPTRAPFSPGQGWGRGFLLGGLLAFFSVLGIFRALRPGSSSARVAATFSLLGALIGASIPLLWMRPAVIEALLGAALGWLAVSLVWILGIGATQPLTAGGAAKSLRDSEKNSLATLILNGAAFAVTLLGVAALGVYRDFIFADVARGTYSAVALALAASVALVFLLDALLLHITLRPNDATPISAFSTSKTVSNLLLFPLSLSLIAPLGIAYLLAIKVLDDLTLVYVVAAGLILGGLLWGLARDDARQGASPSGEGSLRPPLAATIVALCGFMLAYQLMQGFGVGVMLLCAWPFFLLALPSRQHENEPNTQAKLEVAQTLSILATFTAILLLSRLFAIRFRADLHGAGFDDQFALFGLIGGAILPSILASLGMETPQGAATRSLWRFSTAISLPRLFCLGALALASLGAMLALWGAKVVPAFLIGLALSSVGFISTLAGRLGSATTALLALSLAVTATQWTHRFLPLAELSRAQRLHFLLWGVGSLVLLLLLIDYTARVFGALKNRRAPQNTHGPGVSL